MKAASLAAKSRSPAIGVSSSILLFPPPTNHLHRDDTELLNAVRGKAGRLIELNIRRLTDELISSEEGIIWKSSSRAEYGIDAGRERRNITPNSFWRISFR